MKLSPHQVFEASNGAATQRLYAELQELGPAGVIALNLSRACKCSGRAKEYRPKYKREAYGRKEWSLGNLCNELERSAEALGIKWGWKEDPKQPFHKWVLYVEIPTGQVSFHNGDRLHAKNYAGEWDQTTHSPARIIKWTTQLLNGEAYEKDRTSPGTQQPEPMPPLQRNELDEDKLRHTPGRKTTNASRRLEMLDLWEMALGVSRDGRPAAEAEHNNGVGVVSCDDRAEGSDRRADPRSAHGVSFGSAGAHGAD